MVGSLNGIQTAGTMSEACITKVWFSIYQEQNDSSSYSGGMAGEPVQAKTGADLISKAKGLGA
jgi:hypothetical protein